MSFRIKLVLFIAFFCSKLQSQSSNNNRFYYAAPVPTLPKIEAQKDTWLGVQLGGQQTVSVDAAYSFKKHWAAYMKYDLLSLENGTMNFQQYLKCTQRLFEFGGLWYSNPKDDLRANVLATVQLSHTDRTYYLSRKTNIDGRVFTLMPYASWSKNWLSFSSGVRISHVRLVNVKINAGIPTDFLQSAGRIDADSPYTMAEFVFSTGFNFKYLTIGSNLRLQSENILVAENETLPYSTNVWLAIHPSSFFK